MTDQNKDDFSKLFYAEQTVLRAELSSLKNCQITFLNYAVTGTGLLLGVAVNMAGTDKAPFPSLGAFYLIPLVILMPFWWIFFDKATTITRIVGYYRILEDLIIHPDHGIKFIGWENSLAKFRKQYGEDIKIDPATSENPMSRLFRLLLLQVSQKYWMLTFYTFMSLSLLSLTVCIVSLRNAVHFLEIAFALSVLMLGFITGSLKDRPVQIMTVICILVALFITVYFVFITPPSRVAAILMIVAAFLVGLSTSRNFIMVWRLSWGDHSYYTNHELWKGILEFQDGNDLSSP